MHLLVFEAGLIEIAVIAGLGIATLVGIAIAIRVLKAAIRAAVTTIILIAIVAFGMTWGRPYLEKTWATLTSPKSDALTSPLGGIGSKAVETAEENARVRGEVLKEFARQDQFIEENNKRGASPAPRGDHRRAISRGVVRRESR